MLSREKQGTHDVFSEPLSVATRWLALTRSYNKLVRSESSNEEVATNAERWLRYNLDGLSFILQMAGCKDPAVPNVGTLRILFGPGLERLVHMAHELASVMRERIVSSDFDVILEEIGTPFDPVMMQSVFGHKSSADNANVIGTDQPTVEIVCTVEFGLRCTAKAPLDDPQDTRLQHRLLLKPKVVLPSVLQTLRADTLSSSEK